MIIEVYNTKSFIANQRIRFKTELFGKNYFWLTDHDGTWYLLPEKDGEPVFA